MIHICFGIKVTEAWSKNPLMGYKESKKNSYGLWKVLLGTIQVGYERDKWFKITAVSYYIDDILYSLMRSTAPDTEVCISLVTARNSRIKVMLDQ